MNRRGFVAGATGAALASASAAFAGQPPPPAPEAEGRRVVAVGREATKEEVAGLEKVGKLADQGQIGALECLMGLLASKDEHVRLRAAELLLGQSRIACC